PPSPATPSVTSCAPCLALGDELVEPVGVDLADALPDDEAIGIDEERLGRPAHAEVKRRLTVRVVDDGPRTAQLTEEVPDIRRGVVEDHAEHGGIARGLMALGELDQF